METTEYASIWSHWFGRLLVNFGGYLMVLLPCFLTKYMLVRSQFDRDDRSKTWRRCLIYFYYGKAEDNFSVASISSKQYKSGEQLEKDDDKQLIQRGGTLVFCAASLWGSLIIYGLCTERIMKHPYTNVITGEKEDFKNSQFLIFWNRFTAALITGVLLLIIQRKTTATVGFYNYSYASICNLLSSWFKFEALKLVSFTTVIIAKGSRLFPVMFVNKVMKKTQFHPVDWITAFLLCTGSIVYMKSKDMTPEDSDDDNTAFYAKITGLLFLLLYVMFDSLTANYQEKLCDHNVKGIEMAFGTSFFTSLLLATSLVYQGGFTDAIGFLQTHEDITMHCTALALSSAFSQVIIAFTIKHFGAVIFTIIMIAKVIPQVLLSYIFFDGDFGIGGWIGIGILFVGLLIKMTHKLSRLCIK